MNSLLRKIFLTSLIIAAPASFLIIGARADTIHLKDKSSLKGIVVEDYADRVVYSTADGEKEIMRSDIIRIDYDEKIDNLSHLGDSAFEEGYYKAALKYYLMAQKINPDISALNNKIYHTEAIIYKMPEIHKRERLAIKNEIISGRISRAPQPTESDSAAEEELRKELGISLSRKEDGRFYINSLTKKSPFKKAGAEKRDIITAVWSKLCAYLSFADLSGLFLNPNEQMIRVTIQRNIKFSARKSFNAKLAMRWKGTVVESAPETARGLKEGDLLVAIDGRSLRYTPLKKIMRELDKAKAGKTVTIQRKLTVFK